MPLYSLFVDAWRKGCLGGVGLVFKSRHRTDNSPNLYNLEQEGGHHQTVFRNSLVLISLSSQGSTLESASESDLELISILHDLQQLLRIEVTLTFV